MSFEAEDIESVVSARILIVEDEGIVVKDLQNSLRSLGYTVCGTASSGIDAVSKAELLQPDLLLMDIRLRGDMDGIEAARRIRERLDVPIVFLTAYADPDTLERAAAIGPFGYVLKPFDDRELQVTMVMAMCKHRAFAELDRKVKERTEELARSEARYRRLESVAGLGLFALRNPDLDAVARRAVEVVAMTLGTEMCKLLELMPDGQSLLLRAGAGWKPGLVGKAMVTANRGSQAGYTLISSEPVVVEDLATETRFSANSLLRDHGVVSGISVIVHAPGPDGQPFGVLGAHTRSRHQFSGNDVHFLQAVANTIATAIMRSSAEAQVREAERMAQEERVRTGLAEQALRARDEFLSVASHELRTPVAALQLQLESIRQLLAPHAAALDPRVADKTERAVASIARLASLIEGVLDVSRIALGSLVLQREQFDLAEAVGEVVLRQEELARRAGCELRFSAGAPVCGRWDRTRVEQIVTNLLSNAIKFGAGKPIDIHVEGDGTSARLRVQDFGPGIHPDDAHRIFERFERAVSHRNYGGLGLGLYIAGQIVAAHGGSLLASNQPGAGAAFTMNLPLEPDEPLTVEVSEHDSQPRDEPSPKGNSEHA